MKEDILLDYHVPPQCQLVKTVALLRGSWILCGYYANMEHFYKAVMQEEGVERFIHFDLGWGWHYGAAG